MREINSNPKLESTIAASKKPVLGRKGGQVSESSEASPASVKRVGFENHVKWAFDLPPEDTNRTKIAFVVTTSEHPDQIILWMSYHRAIGVSKFYLFTEGIANSAESIEQLSKEPGVDVIPRDANLTEAQSRSRTWNETWLSAFFNKPCNHELFVKQSLNMESTSTASKIQYDLRFLVYFVCDQRKCACGALQLEFNLLGRIRLLGSCILTQMSSYIQQGLLVFL